jgi:hypothetical protein
MRMRWVSIGLAAVAAALVLAGSAAGVGPWPGLAGSVTSQAGVRYTATRAVETTVVRAIADGAVARSATVSGLWGIPAVTVTAQAGGLDPRGTKLVLVEPPTYQGLRSQSKFLVLDAGTLAVERTIVLPGEFGFDAVSPDGRTLYVIQHRLRSDLVAYVVRAYDLAHSRLLRRPVVAAGEGTTMRGYPVARATTSTGARVYTLYFRNEGGTYFVHALATVRRTAVCIDLPHSISSHNSFNARLALSKDGTRLAVRAGGKVVATIDTTTNRVL